jgi:hypothetical protein
MELFKEFVNRPDELHLKLAQHTADEWLDLYKYQPFRRKMPAIFQRYQEMTPDQQKKFNADNKDWINDDEEMKKYAYHKHQVQITNEGSQRYLEETVRILEKDSVRRAKVEHVLAQYPTAEVRVAQVDWHDQG